MSFQDQSPAIAEAPATITKARINLVAFVKLAMPEQKLYPHQELILKTLSAMDRGEIKRLTLRYR